MRRRPCLIRWPDVNPHSNRSSPFLKLAEKIANFKVRTGLILGTHFSATPRDENDSEQHVFLKTMDMRNETDTQ